MNAALDRPARVAREIGPGVVGSLLLHLIVACLMLLFIVRTNSPPRLLARFVPVEIVQFAEKTTSTVRSDAAVQHPRATRASSVIPTSPRRPVPLSPSAKRVPVDDLDMRLKALARLRQPDTALPLPDNGAADATTQGDGASSGEVSAYSLRDFIRAQVERRWNLDLSRLGGRNFVVPIHLVVGRNGDVKVAEISDRERSASDAVYRQIALSARNAVLLSSPIQLPIARPHTDIDIILLLNPRDVLR